METMPNISMVLLAIQHNNGDQQHMVIDVAPDGSIKVRKPFTIRFASGLSVDVIITLTFRTSCGQAFASFADDRLEASKTLRAGGSCDFPVTPCYFKPKTSSISKELRNRCTLDVCINGIHVGSVPIKVFQKSTSFGNGFHLSYTFQLTPESVLPSQLTFLFTHQKKPANRSPPSSPQKPKAKTGRVAKTTRSSRRSSLDLVPLLPVGQRSTEAGMSTSSPPPPLASLLTPDPAFTPSAFFQTSSSSASSSTLSSSSSPSPFALQSSGDGLSLTSLDSNPWHSDDELAFDFLYSLSQEAFE